MNPEIQTIRIQCLKLENLDQAYINLEKLITRTLPQIQQEKRRYLKHALAKVFTRHNTRMSESRKSFLTALKNRQSSISSKVQSFEVALEEAFY